MLQAVVWHADQFLTGVVGMVLDLHTKQRLKCETTGRSATAPDLDDEGSPRGAAYRYTHIGRGHNATLNILS